MPASGAFGVIRMDRAPLEGGDLIVHVAGLVERVGVDGDLDVFFLRDPEAAVDRGGRRAPILVQLEPDRSRADLLEEAVLQRGVPLAGEADVERKVIRRLQHAGDVPGAWRA